MRHSNSTAFEDRNRPRPRIAIVLELLIILPAANLLILLGATEQSCTAADDPYRPPAIAAENVPTVPSELIERLRQYQNVRSAGFLGWSPDGKGILIGTRFGETSQLHRVYEPGGRREQITFFHEPVGGTFLPEATDGALLVTMSQGGDENYQIHLLDRATGRSTLLTDGTSRNLLGSITRDGSRMVVASNRRNGRDTDLYLANPREAGSLKMLLETDGEYWTAEDWSPDGKRLLIKRYVSINESYPAVLDVDPGKKAPLPIPGDGPAAFSSLKFSRDGGSVYLSTDARGEFRQLARLDLKMLEYTWLTDDIPWDVESIEVWDGVRLAPRVESTRPASGLQSQVAFTVNENGASALYLLDGDKARRVDVPLGIIGSLEFSPDGKELGFTLSRPTSPADAYSLRLADGHLTRWTYSEVGGLDTTRFIEPTQIEFPTFDGRKIPAYYYKPAAASAEKPAAVLISIHGGPEGQSRPSFSGLDQFYLNEFGIAVIYPNVRGSAGYGKTYLKLDNAEKREDSVRDIGALLDWIAGRPELDASRVAVIGGSYGGYMVLASLTHYSDRLKAGVDIVGIASFTTFLKNTSAYRRDLRRAEYGDERDPQMQAVFERINPTANAQKIRSALLVAHGRNDPRVPFSEAEQIADKVRSGGREVWTLYADNEGHGFSKKANRDYLTAVIALFVQAHLK